MNFEEIDLDFLTQDEIIRLYNEIIDSSETEDKLHIIASCSVVNGSSYCKSDERLKDNISDNLSGLKEINSITIKNYIYKDDKDKTPHVGVIAQQLKEVFPNAVFEDEKGYLSIRIEDIFYSMVNAIKELYVLNQDLNTKLNEIITKINIEK